MGKVAPNVRRRTAPSRKSTNRRQDELGGLGEWLRYLGVFEHFNLYWPPDVFAVAAGLLKRTGGYVHLLKVRGGVASISSEASRVGREWRTRLVDEFTSPGSPAKSAKLVPDEIDAWFGTITAARHSSFEDSRRDTDLQLDALRLCIACDEACVGIGVNPGFDTFTSMAHAVLASTRERSFCLSIRPEKLCVLGKQHTPQRGCTIRSLTHHLSLHSPLEIETSWNGPFIAREHFDVLNLLLLPWPTAIQPGDFKLIPGTHRYNSGFRYFEYAPPSRQSGAELTRRVERALRGARHYASRIHGIVLPECALSMPEYEAVEKVAIRNGAILVAGVRRPPVRGGTMPRNTCIMQPAGWTQAREYFLRERKLREIYRQYQDKHHRWCLDQRQILQYELGGRIPASCDSWEHIDIEHRRIKFFTIADWLTICALVCEDLARQEPVSEVVRSIGPNLVIALLMDGPQLKQRWPSRYASVLAEDPGCSVLTLTSLGMAQRSRSGEAPEDSSKSRVIALWRDAMEPQREIALKPGDDCCVLSLVDRKSEEFTLDGRKDIESHFPIFAGSYSFRIG